MSLRAFPKLLSTLLPRMIELLLTSRTKIEPSANLTWKPCFDDFACSRLQVPLDYSNKSLGTTSIAFIKLAGENATAESPSIVLIPGKLSTTIHSYRKI